MYRSGVHGCQKYIPAVILKECCSELSDSLCALFNMSLASGYIPLDWQSANVVPIFKAANRQDYSEQSNGELCF